MLIYALRATTKTRVSDLRTPLRSHAGRERTLWRMFNMALGT